jgi:hypothetical protein
MSRRKSLLVVSLVAGALLSSRAASAETWRGDFETGDLKQWDKAEMVAGDPIRLKIVDATELAAYGVRQGKYALRVTVKQGDDPISASGNRAELVHAAGKPYVEGDDIYLGWSTLFPTDFGTTDTWQVFTQFHHTGCCGSPPLEFDISKDKLQLVSQKEGVFDATTHWSTALVRGKWHDFVWHIKWSKDPAIGLVELWYDGAHVLPVTHVRTLFSDGKAYLKQGYYRNDTITWPGVLYHDGTNVGTTYDSVAPPTGTDAGVGDAATGDSGADAATDATIDARPAPDATSDTPRDAFSPDTAVIGAEGRDDAGADADGPTTDGTAGCGCVHAGERRAPGAPLLAMTICVTLGALARRGRARLLRE